MVKKAHTEFFNKHLFSFLIAASLAIHGIIFLLSPQASQILSLGALRERFVREPSEYAVTLEFEDTDISTESAKNIDTEEKEAEPEKKEDKEKKNKVFVDTSDNAEEEEPDADTDKIGEKGSFAKDNFPDNGNPINNEPHAEGHSKAPLLGKGLTNKPVDSQQPQGQVEVPVSAAGIEKDSLLTHADLPQGIEKQTENKTQQVQQPHLISEAGSKINDIKLVNFDDQTHKDILETPKKEMLSSGRGTEQEDATEPLPQTEGVLFTDKQDTVNKSSENEKESLITPQEQKVAENNNIEPEKPDEKKDAETHEQELPENQVASPDVESLRRLDRGLGEQENLGGDNKSKVSFNINTKKDGASNDPVIYEDTLSNAAISGAPSFNVKQHEYATYFKHIRDRISLYWFLGYGTRAEIKLETKDDKPIIIEFKVLPDGSIGDVAIVDDAGNFNLASRLISSVKNAAPLNPFPDNIKEPSIDVRFNFYFF